MQKNILILIAIAAIGFFLYTVSIDQQPVSSELRVAVNAGPEGAAIKALENKYEEQTGHKVPVTIVELPYDSLRQQLITALNDQHSDFDVVMVDDPWFPQIAKHLSTINDVPDSLINDIVPASLNLCRYPQGTNELRALPFVGNTQLLFYRKDILNELGITSIPDTWKKLASLALEIPKRTDNKIFGYTIRGRSGAPIVTDFLPIFWSIGGRLVDDRNKPESGAVDEALFIEALEIYRDLKDASPPGAVNYDWSEMTSAFTNGDAIFQLNWPAAITLIEDALSKQSKVNAWGIALPPGDGKTAGTSMIGNWLLAVPQDSTQIDEGQRFIVWLMNQQGDVASIGNPPTRVSVFKKLAGDPKTQYFSVIETALKNSTPRVRSAKWAQIENSVSQAVSGYITGDLTAQESYELLAKEIDRVFAGR